MSWIKSVFSTFSIVFLVFVGIELTLKHFYHFDEVVLGDTACKKYLPERNYSVYKPNCSVIHKHWEQSDLIEYNFNEHGRRDFDNGKTGDRVLAFFGDSFTLGAMVPISDTYTYKALELLDNYNLTGHNYGVTGEQFENIIAKLKLFDHDAYDLIIYGLTPNDLFDFVDGKNLKLTDLQLKTQDSTGRDTFKLLKQILLSTATSRALLHFAMRNDDIYLSTYMARRPYSEYLEAEISPKYERALSELTRNLNELPQDLKNKIIIFLLPQRAEVVKYRITLQESNFASKFLTNCKHYNLNCNIRSLENLVNLPESHYPVDGHLTVKGNHAVAIDLAEAIKNWRYQ